MSTSEALFLLGRLVIAGLCLVAAAAALRRMAETATAPARPRGLLGLIALVLAIGAGLALHDAWENLIDRADLPLSLGSWLWMGFDLAVPLLALRVLTTMRERDAALAELAALSMTDPLTGLANRRGFEGRALPALAAARRAGAPVGLILLDLDRFKAINDRFGHPAGDAVLRGVAAAIRASLRAEDIAARVGGEEFVLLLPATDAAGAAQLAERLREAVRQQVAHPGAGRVTVSLGVSRVGAGAAPAALAAAMAAADAALYEAKRAGRDRVVLAGDDNAPAAVA